MLTNNSTLTGTTTPNVPRSTKSPLKEHNQQHVEIDEEMIFGQSPVRSVDISIRSVAKKTPVLSRAKLIESGLQTATSSESESSSSSDDEPVVTSKRNNTRKQTKPRRKVKVCDDSSQCSGDGSVLKTSHLPEDVGDSASSSDSEREGNAVREKGKTSEKKKVPIMRALIAKSDAKYLDSDYSESDDGDKDGLDFDESFNTRNKNAIKSRRTQGGGRAAEARSGSKGEKTPKKCKLICTIR